MISTPQNFQHKAHASMDGSTGTGNLTEGNQFTIESPPRISRHIRADSETSSDMTPLISSRSSFNSHRDQANSASTKPTSRMGHAIGYIREKNSNPSNFGNSMISSRSVVGIKFCIYKTNKSYGACNWIYS